MRTTNSITIDGNNNITITEVENSQITVNTVSLEEFTQRYTRELHEQIQERQKLLERTETAFEYERLKLSGEINTLQAQVEEKEKQIRSIIQYYEHIDISTTSALYQQALHRFMNGELKAALEILGEATLDEQERQQAENRVLKAHILRLQYQFDEAEKNLLRAVQIYPSWENYLVTANYYADLNKFTVAESYYERCLDLSDSKRRRATTLNNIGSVQSVLHKYVAAELSYREALEIRYCLSEANPQLYLPSVATTLNNIGNVWRDVRKYEAAEKSYNEALDIYRKLSEENLQVYAPSVAATLNNIGNMQSDIHAYEAAEKNYNAALDIYRKLSEKKPQVYGLYLATVLHNIGTIQHELGEHILAESSYREVLKIYRTLSKENYQGAEPNMAGTLNNMGTVQRDVGECASAELSYREALSIYRRLSESSLQVYLPDIAMVLNNLGIVQSIIHEYSSAESSYREALDIYRRLSEGKPQVYLLHMAETQINMGIFYQKCLPDREQSLVLLYDAISNLLRVIRKSWGLLVFWVKKDGNITIAIFARSPFASF